MSGPPAYYRPYDSGEESSSDESSGSWYSSGSDQKTPPPQKDGIPNFRAFASAMQLMGAAGRSFSTITDELTYGADKLGKMTFSKVDLPQPPPDPDELALYGSTKFETASATEASIIMIDSQFRDRTAYPQPTLCTLRLPRSYKNVTSIGVSELKLITSFYFFQSTFGNTDITIYEKNRYIYDAKGKNLGSTIVKTYISQGSFNLNSLMSEIQNKLNYTPLFFDFKNGFNDFLTLFRASGDLTLNFNQPGDNFYNNTIQQNIVNPTMAIIAGHFWSQLNFNFTSYSLTQTQVAYYYPVLSEIVQDQSYRGPSPDLTVGLGIDDTINTIELVVSRIVLTFQGLDDPVILAIILANIPVLETYRLRHTFRYFLINKYSLGANPQTQNVYVTTPSLNTSLLNLLAIQQGKFQRRAFTTYNTTAKQFAALQTQAYQYRAVLQGMYDFEQQNFLTYFGVPWSQYSLDYYAGYGNAFYIQNGADVVGLPSNDLQAIASNIQTVSTNLLSLGVVNPNYYWPNLSSVGTSVDSTYFLFNLSNATSTFNSVYKMVEASFDDNNTIINPTTSEFYSDYLAGSADVVCPIRAGKYTVFQFNSPVRQTLQIETLPRPLEYRLPAYNLSNYNPKINTYFDMTYNFSSNLDYSPTNPKYYCAYDNLPRSNLQIINGWASSNSYQSNSGYSWTRSFSNSLLLANTLQLNITTNYRTLFLTFTTPAVPDTLSSVTYSLNLTIQSYQSANSSNLVSPIQPLRIFFYHDRAGFQADVLSNRNENPFFYKFSTILETTSTSKTVSFTTYPQQTYYLSIRPDSTNFGTTFIKAFPWFNTLITSTIQTNSIVGLKPATDPFLSNFSSLITRNFNYAQLYDSNYIQLPIQSTLWGRDPAAVTSNYGVSAFPIGYDTNGISTDYTDYIPYIQDDSNFSFSPIYNLGIDPMNKFLFQSNSAYDSTTQTYFPEETENGIFYPSLSDIYEPTTVPVRETKITHYYSLNYIPEPDINFPINSNILASNGESQRPYTLATTGEPIQGYLYGSQDAIQLGRGVIGFSFIPGEGLWTMKRVVFRSAIVDPVNDPNNLIKYMGVFNMGEIINKRTTDIFLSSAMAILSSVGTASYSNNEDPDAYGFDVKGGTYYQFDVMSNFQPKGTSTLQGYDQIPGTMSAQPESMYSLIAFSEYGTPIGIRALSGSAIPYPLFTSVGTSNRYIDGTRAYNNKYGVVFPLSNTSQTDWPFASGPQYGPSANGDETQSQYALSTPLGTTVLNYKTTLEIYQDSNYLNSWSTPMTPSKVVGTTAGYVLFQDTDFSVYTYSPYQIDKQFTTSKWTLSADQVFPQYEDTAIVGITGNTNYFYFIGLSNLSVPSNSIRMKKYDPVQGILTELSLHSSFRIPWHSVVRSVTVNDFEQLVMTVQNIDTAITTIYYSISTTMTSFNVPGGLTAVHAMDATTSTLYWMPQNSNGFGSSLYRTELGLTLEQTQITLLGGSNWTNFTINAAATLPSSNDRIFATANGYQSNIFYSDSWDGTTANLLKVATALTLSSGKAASIGSITGGYGGSIWITSSGNPFVWINRNSDPDLGGVVGAAWQIFYPFQKIILEKIANTYNAITDTTYINYPEYPHTALFYYRDGQSFSNDTSQNWGLESINNFLTADTVNSGYMFNSYIFNVPLIASSNDSYQYLAVRGTTPSENSETLLRLSLTNTYNFGYVTTENLIDEIDLYVSTPTLFNPTYGKTLAAFNNSFVQSNSFFGQGLIQNFDGSNYNSVNFKEFSSNMSTVYSDYVTVSGFIAVINNYINTNITFYISTTLPYIFPTDFQTRQSYTAPIPFTIMWKSGLLPQYANLLKSWGLGYNLGFNKIDTPYSTYTSAQSFYKILEDYIYLKLNQEYPMNKLDSTSQENFSVTRDPTGQIGSFFGKLLLNNFNTYSRSFVSNTLEFNPPIPRLDFMYFEWVDVTGATLNNNDCEWAASLNVKEAKMKATATSSQPALPPPPK
jgi:hypothetical protein